MLMNDADNHYYEPDDCFTRHQPASIEYYIAKLQHVRFAYASEGEEGAKLSESLIKDVTGCIT